MKPQKKDIRRIRAFAITSGRTTAKVDIPLETIIITSDLGKEEMSNTSFEKRDILEMCMNPLAVAEIAAHLHVPLGTAQVLVGDLAERQFVNSSSIANTAESGPKENVRLLEKVLLGIQAL